MRRRVRLGWLWSLLFVVLLVAACGFDPTDLSGRDCPCVAGYVCDDATNRCVRPDDLVARADGSTGDDGNVETDGGADALAPDGDGAPPCVGEGCACSRDQDCLDPAFGRCAQNKCSQCSQPDNCPANKYCLDTFQCAPGCKLDGECAGGDAGTSFCKTSRHQCVECLTPGDCPQGKLCSPSGKCVDGCDIDAGKNCVAGSCCSSLCLNVTNDVFNCGGCGQACSGGDTLCCASSCTNPLTSALNCGACGNACSTLNGTPNCSAGACKWTCNPGYSHCQVGNTGCDTNTATDPTHCGTCSTVCASVVQNATGIGCTGGGCTYGSCNSGWGSCDSNAANGCETNLNTDLTHCGGCSTVCSAQVLNATGITCTNGGCGYTACVAGYADCDGIAANGCEANLNTDPLHCGTCVTSCATQVQNASGAACSAGLCTYTACSAGFGNCDANATNGCETNTTNDATHCGTCPTMCSAQVQNASGIGCASSACNYTACNSGYASCDSNATNGCETNTTNDATHCGSCPTNCNTQVQNASGKACVSSLCTYTSCSAGFASCDSVATNGCETNTTSDVTRCGNCSTNCNTQVQNASGIGCSASACTYTTCSGGFANCDLNATNGCEVNTTSDLVHCGTCATNCNTQVANATGKACVGSVCGYSACSAGYASCDGISTNGCEVNTTNDVAHCGNCVTSCTTQVQHATGITCSTSACNYTACAAGYGDCDGVRSNGCECICGGSNQQCCPAPTLACIPGKACEASTNLCK